MSAFEKARIPLAVLLVTAVASCGRQAEDAGSVAPPEWAVERARTAADALTGELAGKLGEELREGGPAAAVAVCSEVAQNIAAEHSREGLSVRRVSLRVRNPADRPDAFERQWLERMEERHRAGEPLSETSEVAGTELRYMRPLFIAGLCLECHGDPAGFDAEVRQILAERYPEDQAVGYETGDLRGAVSVRVHLEAPDPEEPVAMDDGDRDPRVPEETSPIEEISATAPDGTVTRAVLRRPLGGEAAPIVVMLHGGLEPLPTETLALIARRGYTANRFLRAGYAVVVPTRRARPDAARPSGAVQDTVSIVAAARRALGASEVALFGSSGGGDLALEVAGEIGPVAIVVEEPATSLLTGILAADTPKSGETWSPDEVWPADYAGHYTPARRDATRKALERIDCPILIAQGDQPIAGIDQLRPLDAVLVPELEALGKRVVRRVYPGQEHGFGLVTGVPPDPVPAATAAAAARFFDDAERFIRDTLSAPPRPVPAGRPQPR